MRLLTLFLATLLFAASSPLVAHEIPARVTVHNWVRPEPGRLTILVRVPLEAMRDVAFPLHGKDYLDVERSAPLLRQAADLWLADAFGPRADGRTLGRGTVTAARIALPSDASFAAYETANAGMDRSIPAGLDLPWQQAMLHVRLEWPLSDGGAELTLSPALAHLGLSTTSIIRFAPIGSASRTYQYVGDPGLVRLDPRWHHAALQFVKLGFLHILGGLDHLLFLLCLVLPMRRLGQLLVVITSFTVAHSITLLASALGYAPDQFWFPPLIETLIALSIVWMALENIVGARVERRWVVAFAFGLVHGFGFSFLLRDSLQLAGGHLAASLIAFNAGVELGQIAVLAVLVPALALLFRYVLAERIGIVLASAFVAHSAWHWMTERAGELRQVPFSWPALDLSFALVVSRTLLLVCVSIAALAAVRMVARRFIPGEAQTSARPGLPATPAAHMPPSR